ncbi:MAG: glycosyltransferase family 4 protein, partial [Syntrophomonadaceae bacterium]
EDIYSYKNRKFGDKFYWRYLRKLIEKSGLAGKVIFLGVLDATTMAKEMAKSAVFVSASACENSPNSVCEAMLIGLPVIASDVGGVSDIITHKVDGLLYPFNSPYMLTHYIDCLFSSRDVAIGISQNAKVSIRKKCSPEIVVSEVISAYDNILSDKI